MRPVHKERHLSTVSAGCAPPVLGANDGLVSTASLIVGWRPRPPRPARSSSPAAPALVAGAMSMAAGEYVSSVPRPTPSRPTRTGASGTQRRPRRRAGGTGTDLRRPWPRPSSGPPGRPSNWMAKDALGAHARYELGISEVTTARPVQAALTSRRPSRPARRCRWRRQRSRPATSRSTPCPGLAGVPGGTRGPRRQVRAALPSPEPRLG